MKSVHIPLLLGGLILLSACAPTRRLSSGQQLFEGAEIQLAKPTAVVNKKGLKEEMLSLIRPPSNNTFKLWIFNLVSEPKKPKGFKYWLKYKVGEPPVLFDLATANRNRLVLEKYLQENGYLNATVRMDTVNQPQKVKVIYQIQADRLYRINHIYLPKSSSALDQLARENQQGSFLKEKQVYHAEDLRSERSRLAVLATQNGYFGVNENDLYFYIDTTKHLDSLDLYVQWKPAADSTGLQKYLLGQTSVYPDYSLIDSSALRKDTILHENLRIIENAHFFRESLFSKAIRGQTGALYDGRLQTSTLNYLQDLDVFKFINLHTEKRQENGQYFLDRAFYLTPASFRDIRFDFEANTRSGSYFGLLAAVNYSDKNWLGGAEHLALNLSIGGETQIGSGTSLINTLEITAGASLAVPRLLLPFATPQLYRNYVARTRFNLSNAYQIRNGFFTINRLTANMAYDWRSNRYLRHVWTPFSISQSQTFNIDPAFQLVLDQNSRLKNSLENTFILGGQYQITYSDQDLSKIRPYFFFSGSVGLAGNIPALLAGSLTTMDKPYRVLGSPFSQFFKLYFDARYYLERRKRSWAFRLATGFIAPYGNASTAPYSEQFFIGGSTSLRAFYLRALGPGSYVNPDRTPTSFFDQTGDIKLELNAEYRFDLAAYFKGALFVDAGNIWLINQTIGDQQGRFNFNTFYNEIAVGTGIGLRIDFNYFVIRLDTAFPIRKPILNKGFAWTLNQLDFLDKNWRSENLVWHLALGYPF